MFSSRADEYGGACEVTLLCRDATLRFESIWQPRSAVNDVDGKLVRKEQVSCSLPSLDRHQLSVQTSGFFDRSKTGQHPARATGLGKIQIELPGGDGPQRVLRKGD